jgi:hypothetical protein
MTIKNHNCPLCGNTGPLHNARVTAPDTERETSPLCEKCFELKHLCYQCTWALSTPDSAFPLECIAERAAPGEIHHTDAECSGFDRVYPHDLGTCAQAWVEKQKPIKKGSENKS